MGYTNYWYQENDIPNDKWKLIKDEYNNYINSIPTKNEIAINAQNKLEDCVTHRK